MYRHLPSEMWTEILTKLQVKSILRCRSVCKTWYSLVSCPTFISNHSALTLNQSTGDRVLVVHRGVSKLSFHDKPFVESHVLPELLDLEIVGSSNGLICFSRYNYNRGTAANYESFHSFKIWNPSIRKIVELPLLHSPLTPSFEYLLGFGFDPQSRDYKVVRFAFHGSTDEAVAGDEVVAECAIFDLTKGVWRSSSYPMRTPPRFFHNRQHCLCLHGNLHWIGYDRPFADFNLVCFSLSSEVLHEIPIAPEAAKSNGSYTVVMQINGLLSLAVVKIKRQGAARPYCISVWSAKEYGVAESWTKLFNIDLPDATNLSSLQRLSENGEILLVSRNKDFNLVLYNHESGKSKDLLSSDKYFHTTSIYKESLVLL